MVSIHTEGAPNQTKHYQPALARMAHHAWLDSLSEDWVSQPSSDTSQQEQQLPTPSSPPMSANSKDVRDRTSRIPRLNAGNAGVKRPQHQSHNSSPSVLSERTPNDVNIKAAQLGPSKLSQELKLSYRGRQSRSASASTASSVIHNSALHNKSQSASPSKSIENAPEWKRRLVYGELDYGESKDLFCSAGTGLENIFRPPQAPENEGHTINETTLPSSPPPYSGMRQDMAENDDISEQDTYDSSVQHNMSLPKPITFRPTGNDSTSALSDDAATMREEECVELETQLEGASGSSAMSLRRRQLLDESRKTSGQSVIRNEEFSPIFIARHSSEGGRVSFAPELPANQLRKKLEVVQRNQMILDREPDSDADNATAASLRAGDHEDTEDFAKNGGFLNLRRARHSIQGSLRRWPLDPSINIDTSEMLPESSLQASTPKQFPTVRTERIVSASGNQTQASSFSPPLPRAPHPSPAKHLQPPSSKSTSPLKLFGPYDTFTNQTLLRRISQLEEQHSNNVSFSADDTAASPTPMAHYKSESHDEFTNSSVPATRRTPEVSHGHHEIFGAVNSFGAGELDGYEFDGDISLGSSIASRSEEKENVIPMQNLGRLDNSFKFHIHEDMLSEGESFIVRRNRPKSSRPTSSGRRIRVARSLDGLRSRITPEMNGLRSLFPSTSRNDASEGKRPRTSPSKDPTPKRRRTLHRSDIAYGLEDRRTGMDTVQSSHYTMQSAITRDRKNVRQAELQKLVESNTLAVRQILRPRSPTPSQRASVQRERQPLGELGFNPIPGPAKAPTLDENTQNYGIGGSRKTSMKTQDFYNAAEEVMAMIRNKARPKTGLTSVEESEAESSDRPIQNGSFMTEESFWESTQEPFSRPPSRDGRPVPRLPRQQEDPELVDQLKKYEEHSDLDDMLAQSTRSMAYLKINDQRSHSNSIPNQREYSSSQIGYTSRDKGDIISDIPNVRISRNPEHAEAGSNARDFPTYNSQSSGASTGRSIPTTSSRGSDSKRLIAPDVVAQLIGNQVGNMVYDEENKMWQKVRTPRPIMNVLPSEDSEEDPFASIPDLTVDTTKEKNHLDLASEQNRLSLEHPRNDGLQSRSSSTGVRTTEEFNTSQQTAKGNNQVHIETAVEDDEEIEHEISLHEDRIQKDSPSRRRHLTITFSSPIASIIQDVAHSGSEDNSYEGKSGLDQSLGSITADSIKRGRHGKIGRSVSGMTAKSSSRSRSRGASITVERHTFIPRPVSRIDEQDENASDDQRTEQKVQGHISIRAESSMIVADTEPITNADQSIVKTTPDRTRTVAMSATPIIGQYVGNLSLSHLSEFTMHQVDTSCALEVSYVVGDQYLVTGDGSKKTMSKAIQRLVEKITEVEPFEPDWEAIPELDLSNKQLDTLHKLDEFCSSIVTLDASNNTVSHLDGVPQSVRNLRMTHNLLSELTAWRQFINLQYVDVSNNQLQSLSAFKDLVHLRTLRADNNQITTLDGIKFHDTLQVLRARGNLITHVDFDGTKMQRLTELDLEDNQIAAFENSEQLTCLNTLNLQHNRLTSFAPSEGQVLPCLRYLKLSSNDLETLDVAAFPSLRLLHADRNNITTITGFSHCRRLDSLSLREQKGSNMLDISFLESACEVRKLFLSGNRLSGFSPRMDLLNLQYLELANCGLQSLAPHVGQLMPNLRVLNINFNAIDDLWPLRYIPRLKKLLAAGNRLCEAGKVAKALAEFPHLSRLDLRNNGATLGFYAPVHTLISVEDENEVDPFVLPDVDVERQDKFASRLDLNTRMRKRIYDMVVLNDCRQLKMLDGLPTAKDIADKRDEVWHALVGSGIIKDDMNGNDQESVSNTSR